MQPGSRGFAAARAVLPPGFPGGRKARSRLIRLIRLPPLREARSHRTAHAEYLAAFDAARDCLRMRTLLADLGLPQAGPTPFFEDNETCIRMATTDASTPRMQHLDARYHWLREQVTRAQTIRFIHCPTDLMVADALTKPLDATKTAFFHGAFSGFRPIPRPSLLGGPGRIGLSIVSPATMPLLSDV